MKHRLRIAQTVAVAALACVGWQNTRPLKIIVPTVISLNIGTSYQDVVRASSYPISEHTANYRDTPLDVGSSFVEKPAVILRFTDPKHGFTLPPTKFALIAYSDNKVNTVSTSPMLDTLPFDQAVAVLENLQNQFKQGGWLPWEGDESEWFDLTPTGKKRLYERMFEAGYAESTELRVPGKYSITFRLKCTEGCWTRQPPYRFLVDVGVGTDTYEWWDKLTPEEQERQLPAPQYRKCNGFKAKGDGEPEPERPPMPPCKPGARSTRAPKQP